MQSNKKVAPCVRKKKKRKQTVKEPFLKFKLHRKAIFKISLHAGRRPSPVNNRRFCNVHLDKHSRRYNLYI